MKKYKISINSLLLLVVSFTFIHGYWDFMGIFTNYEFLAFTQRHYWAELLVSLPLTLIPVTLMGLIVWLNWKEHKTTTGTARGVISAIFLAVGLVFFLMFSLLIFDPVLGIVGV